MNKLPQGDFALDTAVAHALPIPPDFTELIELRSVAIEHKLGYFRDEPFVLFAFSPEGGEVIWKDGRSSGFGTGGWRMFLDRIAPVARRYGADVGDIDRAGTHAVLMDRVRGAVYVATFESAQRFLFEANGLSVPARRCLCLQKDCPSCTPAS